MWESQTKKQMFVRGLWRLAVSPHFSLVVIPELIVLMCVHRGRVKVLKDAWVNFVLAYVVNWATIEVLIHRATS